MHNAVFTTAPDDAHALKRSLASRRFLVVGLCAAWCGTCTEFRGGFDKLPELHDAATFVWIDIEDDAEIAGDIDVENFPTLAIFDRGRLVHFGVSLPQAPMISRLLSSLDSTSAVVEGEDAVYQLFGRLADSDDPRPRTPA